VSQDRQFFISGSMFAALGVAAGAFGVHALEDRLTPELLSIFETGARYQLIHALALLAVAWASTRWSGKPISIAGWAFVIGIIIFSGSLYTLSLTGIRILGAITPIGGVAFIVGWISLAWSAWKDR